MMIMVNYLECSDRRERETDLEAEIVYKLFIILVML